MTKKTAKQILLLEDEDALARLYAKKLSEAGYKISIFKNTKSLLEQSDQLKIDAAFLDQSLSEAEYGMSIIPTLKKSNPKIKVAMLSNYSEFQMQELARKAGADDYLLKINTPPAQLVKYVDQLFS